MDVLLSDFDSFSDSSEDQDDIELMYGGHAHCILSHLEETMGKIDEFLSFERAFIHGDIVCSITDPSGQMGKVVNVDMTVDLENFRGSKIKNVNSNNLKKVRSFSVADYVLDGPWLGKIGKIVDRVTILFDDGRKGEFTTMGPHNLVPISPDLLEDSPYPYYPGQRVKVELSSVPKSPKWLCGTRTERNDEGTVCAVDAGFVYVDWLGCALVGSERMPAPRCLQDSKNLTLLQCFSHANWQLGDWCILPTPEHKSIVEQIFFSASSHGLIKGKPQSEVIFHWSNLSPNFQELCVIVKRKIKVDVLWQDGSISLGLDPQLLFPVNVVDAHDFWPEQFVLEKGNCDDPNVPSIKRWGIVTCVDAKERTVTVQWKTFVAGIDTDLEEELLEEIVSAYELIEHPDYAYSLGDVVFMLEKEHSFDLADGKSKKDNVISNTGMVEECDLKGKCYDSDQNECPSNSYLSRIGIVKGIKDGEIEVKWATGLTTKVAPYGIFRVDKYEDLYATPVLYDESFEELNEERTEHDNQSLELKGKDLLNGDGTDSRKNSLNSSSFYFPQAAIGFFTSIAASLFGTWGTTSVSGEPSHMPDDKPRSGIPSEEEGLNFCKLFTEEQPLLASDLTNFEETNAEQKVKETREDKDDAKLSSGSQCPEQFKHFDMVGACSDHYFVDGTSEGLMLSQVNKVWLKKVHQEWTILEKDIPDTIYVRAYEERMDLLRAAIIGAPGTPYHDGLFFFDIFLPPEYPCKPPMVYYNSGGLRVNPNLYESGKVCLSLLNTWTGTGNELWNPRSSTVLQVFLSLQALVLNEKPYFNEAGYDSQIGRAEGEKNSEIYNENAFLVSCKSMIYILRKPPKHFEALVKEHFSQRCKNILSACTAYMEGVPVGCAFGHRRTEEENQKGSSTGFKIMLGKLVPKLVETFSANGIDCSQYVKPEK